MDLIDRYLAAIARRLPAAKAGDIVAEIRDDLLTRQEAREEALGRPLDTEGVAALIRETGHPLVVASRYRAHQYLIGPDAFPFFLATLRIVAMFVLVVLAISVAADVVSDHLALWQAVARGIGDAMSSAIWALGIVVVVFYVLERNGFPADHLAKWRPDHLPEASDRHPSVWGSAFEVALGILLIAWWCGLFAFPLYYTNVKGLSFVGDPVWTQLWWPILALMVARLVYNAIQWLRPRWTVARAVLAVATAAGGLGLLVIVFQAGHWLSARSTIMTPAALANLDRSVNLGLRWAIVVIGVIWLIQCAKALWGMAMARPARVAIA